MHKTLYVRGTHHLFLAGIFLLGIISSLGCSRTVLKPWHTEKLKQELSRENADEITTFNDYLQMEDRLFTELDKKIYSHSETGAAFLIDRYSRGSAADPDTVTPNWNRSFELKAENPRGGVLLLHGMSDSPYSLRALGLFLNRQGYWVIGLRLPGHGTIPSGLRFVDRRDMALSVRLGMQHLDQRVSGRPVHMIGYSTGAPLALEFALDAMDGQTSPVPASLVLISPAIRVHPAAALASLKNTLSGLPGLDGMAYLTVEPEFDPYKYNSFATNAGDVVHRLTRSVSSRIRQKAQEKKYPILPPTLVFKSTVDSTVSTQAVVDDLLLPLQSQQHELVLFDINRHAAVTARLLIDDPAPFTDRVLQHELPFAVTLVTNADNESTDVVCLYKPAHADTVQSAVNLGTIWPRGVLSLSHVALPIAPDDPVYGEQPPADPKLIFLGQMALQGERGLLRISPDWLIRLRYNPFYGYLEQRTLLWLNAQ